MIFSIMKVVKTAVLAHLGSQGDWLNTWKTNTSQSELCVMDAGTIMQTWLICWGKKKKDRKCLCSQLLFPSCSWTDWAISCFINVNQWVVIVSWWDRQIDLEFLNANRSVMYLGDLCLTGNSLVQFVGLQHIYARVKRHDVFVLWFWLLW